LVVLDSFRVVLLFKGLVALLPCLVAKVQVNVSLLGGDLELLFCGLELVERVGGAVLRECLLVSGDGALQVAGLLQRSAFPREGFSQQRVVDV